MPLPGLAEMGKGSGGEESMLEQTAHRHPKTLASVSFMCSETVLGTRSPQVESSLTNIGGHSPIHDVQCFIKFVLDRWVCQHLV